MTSDAPLTTTQPFCFAHLWSIRTIDITRPAAVRPVTSPRVSKRDTPTEELAIRGIPTAGNKPSRHNSQHCGIPIGGSASVADVATRGRCELRINRSCRLEPARRGMIMAAPRSKGLVVCGVYLPTPLDSGLRRNDDPGDLWESVTLSKLRKVVFGPFGHTGWGRHTNR